MTTTVTKGDFKYDMSNVYKTKSTPVVMPDYYFTDIYQKESNGSTTVAIAETSQKTIKFDIPSGCINWFRTLLPHLLTVTAGGAATYDWLCNSPWADVTDIRWLNKQGGALEEMHFINNFTTPRLIKNDDYMLREPEDLMDKCNVAKTVNTIPSSFAVGTANVNYFEPKYATISPANTAIAKQCNPTFGDIKHSVFAKDVTIPCPDATVLEVTFDKYSRYAFKSASATDPTDTTAVVAVTLTNMVLRLCRDQNPETTQKLLNIANSTGFNMVIDHVITDKTQKTGTSHTVAKEIARTDGIKLKRIYHAIFHDTEEKNTGLDNCNGTALQNAIKCTNYHTSVDSKRRQPDTLVCSTASAVGTDWLYNKPNVKHSVINNRYFHSTNHCIIDDFVAGVSGGEYDENADAGIEIPNSM